MQIAIFKFLDLTRLGFEPESTFSVADSLFTRQLIGLYFHASAFCYIFLDIPTHWAANEYELDSQRGKNDEDDSFDDDIENLIEALGTY